ncbi:uncharacterized protein K460DRAFT_398251 [Cucurbitaria berberidis CBS 394.84]|uniref:Uncharacterized protein n=1 Tax=Cucurbitaria berberidis CBS 394.84 TaxID=1168544 RepID=A0A9P4GAY9_9PLEO|nr:uncharacterized protein K460DRAFT_398251 [Cucurbitaria berberidis CBS 394.84]KAF1842204.1 hypothetical protein K460DRAFT_398251 [Cucurbitaria berberidis CBS 394.84]
MGIPTTRYTQPRTTIDIERSRQVEQKNEQVRCQSLDLPRNESFSLSSRLKNSFRGQRAWHLSKNDAHSDDKDELLLSGQEPKASNEPAAHSQQTGKTALNTPSPGKRSLRSFLHMGSIGMRGGRHSHMPEDAMTKADKVNGGLDVKDEELSCLGEVLQRQRAQDQTTDSASTIEPKTFNDDDAEDSDDASLRRLIEEWGTYHKVLVESYSPGEGEEDL